MSDNLSNLKAEIEEDAARIAELVKHFEESKEWETQEKVFEMLGRIDHMHRACIWRIHEVMTELGGKGLVERLEMDPVVKTLFVLYDLLPPNSMHAPPEHQPRDLLPE
ncbi:MAG: hypothetical protein ABIR71_11850 [Chthoniobacterales bacterium]